MTAPSRITTYPKQGTPAAGQVTAVVTNTVSTTGSITASISGSISGSVTVTTVGTSASFTTSQVTITATATPIFAININQIFREVVNPTTSTASIWVGASGVTTTTGLEVPVATAFDMSFNTAALYGITATGSVTVSTIGW